MREVCRADKEGSTASEISWMEFTGGHAGMMSGRHLIVYRKRVEMRVTTCIKLEKGAVF